MVDFGDLQVFEGVTTYPAIVVVEKSKPKPQTRIELLVLEDKLPKNLSQYFVQYGGEMPQSQLSTNSWHLEDERLDALRKKLTQGHTTLKKAYGSPLYGIKTGLNAAFVIDDNTRKRLIGEDPRSEELLKPFLEGKNLKAWHAEPGGLWLIGIPKYWTREQMLIAEELSLDESTAWEWFKNNYPALAAWLEPFAEKARKRGDKGEFWWELRSCAYYDKFSLPKIFYPDLSQGAKFHLDKTGHFAVNTIYFISNADQYLLGLLNSTCCWFFLKGICDAMRGGEWRLRLFGQNMEKIPVPAVTDKQKLHIGDLAEQCQSLSEQRYNIQYNFRRRLPDLCSTEQTFKLSKKLDQWWMLDFDNFQKEIKKSFKGVIPLAERNEWHDYFDAEQRKSADLSQQLVQLENQLNQEVYALFQLSNEEVALLESNLSI